MFGHSIKELVMFRNFLMFEQVKALALKVRSSGFETDILSVNLLEN